MKLLTVFTPTYNRGYCLRNLYESLKRQTSNNFLWLVIDDGSNDNTKELCLEFQKENRVEMVYYYQQNGGKHVAHNKAVEICQTELFLCVDSDDILSDQAVETIENAYKTAHAYTIIAEDGLEVLVHIGIDTVMLGGECFDAKVEVGDYIKKGELICVADIDKILEKGFDPVVVVVVTNAEKMHSQEVKYGKAYAGDEVLLYEIK